MGKKTKAKKAEAEAALPKLPSRPTQAPRARGYDLGGNDRTLASWRGEYYAPNDSIRHVIRKMRARSRDLWENNDYVNSFSRQLRANVYGPKGIIHQSKIKNARGGLNKRVNAEIELAYRIQSERGNWSADKRLSRREFGRRWIDAVARDGGALIRFHTNFRNNATGFAVSLLECDYLADHYFAVSPDGNAIESGIEQNEYGEPVAYWLYPTHPGRIGGRSIAGGKMDRVPASQIRYTYRAEDERPEQSIGVPWVDTAGRRLRQIGEYEQAQLVAAVVGSRKMGFLLPSIDTAGLYSTGETNEAGEIISEVEAGIVEELPPGYDFKTFDPTFPHQELPNFIKAMLRGVAAGLEPGYHSLSGDLESVNYSSIRVGQSVERDGWRLVQDYAIEDMEREVYRHWLRYKIMDGTLGGSIERVPAVLAQQRFQPRGWEYVDAQKEVQASIDKINAGLSSPSLELAKLGLDIEDVYAMIEQDRALAEQHGLTDFLTVFSIPRQATESTTTTNTDQDQDQEQADAENDQM